MNASLAPGLEFEARYTVTKDMAPSHLPTVVLSTPWMIALIERTCLRGLVDHLDDGEVTVGTHVCVSHRGPAYEGEEVVVRSRLTAIDRRRLTFSVEVHSPRERISDGTHERAAVAVARYETKAAG